MQPTRRLIIKALGFNSAEADYLALTDGEPGNAESKTATLGGASITNDAPWMGKWMPLGRVEDGRVVLTVQSTTAVVVRIHKIKTEGARPGVSSRTSP